MSDRTFTNKVLGFFLALAGLIGVAGHIEYAGWFIAVGFILIL